MSVTHTREKLDQFVLDIEFLLISVVQGVALAALAAQAVTPIVSLNYEFFPYIITGFLIILAFWSGAIVHALSFIDWPLDLTHNFLYFLASFIEVIAFSQIQNPQFWFACMAAFFIVVTFLYFIDLSLIKSHLNAFSGTPQKKELFNHIKNEQIFELKYLMPVGLIFCIGSMLILSKFPNIHIYLGISQAIFMTGFLINSIYSFKKRAKLISNTLN